MFHFCNPLQTHESSIPIPKQGQREVRWFSASAQFLITSAELISYTLSVNVSMRSRGHILSSDPEAEGRRNGIDARPEGEWVGAEESEATKWRKSTSKRREGDWRASEVKERRYPARRWRRGGGAAERQMHFSKNVPSSAAIK